MLARVSAVVISGVTLGIACDGHRSADEWNIPEAIRDSAKRELAPRYRVIAHLNPFYLRADLNGDGRPDYVLLVEEASSCKVGLAVFLTSGATHVMHVLGAGKPFRFASSTSDDFSFMDAWQVRDKGTVAQGATKATPPRLLGDAILVEKTEAASGLIYWDTRQFRWYQQGD